jgi:hypothetical protein
MLRSLFISGDAYPGALNARACDQLAHQRAINVSARVASRTNTRAPREAVTLLTLAAGPNCGW